MAKTNSIINNLTHLYVEYCGKWNYEPRFILLKNLIEEKLPNIFDISGNVGRKSSFEVTLNNKLIYSKLEIGLHANYDDLVTNITNIINN